MRLGIGVKLSLLTSLLIVLTCYLSWHLAWQSMNELGIRVLIDHELIDNDDDTHLAGRSLQNYIASLREDAHSLGSRVGGQAGQDDAKSDTILQTFLQDNWIEDRGSAFSRYPRYVRACVFDNSAGTSPLRWLYPPQGKGDDKATQGRRLQGWSDRDEINRARALRPGQVLLSEIDHDGDRFEIHAFAPIYRTSLDRSEGVVMLSLDLTPKFDEIIGDPRKVAILARANGQLLASSVDVDSSAADNAGAIEQIAGLKSPSPVKILGRRPAATLQEQERSLIKPGLKCVYASPDPVFMLAIDIKQDEGDTKVVTMEFLEELQDFLDKAAGDRGQSQSKVIHSTALAQDWPNFYKYAFVRSTDRGKLEAMRRDLVSHPRLGHHAVPREILDCGVFDFKFINVPIDPADPSRFLILGGGMSRNEIRSEFNREVKTPWMPFLGFVGGGGAIAFLFSRILTKPLKRMTQSAERFAEGQTPDSLPTSSRDEIGSLARAFQVMGAQVRARTQELKSAAARTQAILDMAAEGIITINTEGQVESFNRAAERILGYTAPEVIGKHVDMLLPEVSDGLRTNELAELIALGQQDREQVVGRSRVLTGRRKDGTEFPMEIAVGEVELGDRRVFTSIVRDITERRQSEQALRTSEERLRRLNEELDHRVRDRTVELEEAKAQLEQSNEELCAARDATLAAMQAQVSFFDQVAHDLRTPLTSVIGYSEGLLEQATSREVDEFVPDLDLVVRQGAFLLELVNDLLNVSMAMSGKELALKLTSFDVPTMLRNRLPSIDHVAAQNKNTMVLDCPNDIGPMIADEVRVWRILMNLLTNARKFTRKGEIQLSVQREETDGGDHFVFRITDTGIGMAPDQVARLFNRFEQVHAQSATKGFGLGLSTCALYCRVMGGGITVESEVGKGTTFTVRLPAVVRSKNESAATSGGGRVATIRHATEEAAPGRDHPNVILIIDDDPSFGELMRRHLSAQGFDPRIATSGEQGLLLAKQLQPAAILLDVVMPGIDGWAVLAALKTDAATARIPIIMATVVDDLARGVALGADDFVTKPIGRDELAELLRKHLNGRRTERILVVEDNTVAREQILRMLREQGYDVVGAGDGRLALELINATPPDLVLLDLNLPRMDGFEVVERIRKDATSAEIPIIVVTGAELDGEARRRLQDQVVQNLQKGLYGRDELFREVNTVVAELRQHAARTEESEDAANPVCGR